MTSTHDLDAPDRPPPARSPARAAPRFAVAAGLWSLACAALGLWWLLDPARYVLDDVADRPTSLPAALPPEAGSALLLALGLAGAVLAVLLGRYRDGAPGRRALAGAGFALAATAGVVAPDLQLLSLLGYALALLGGPVLVAVLAAGARRSRGNLLVLLAIAAAVGVGVLTGQIGEPTLEMLRGVRDGLGRVGPRPLVLLFLLAGGVLIGAATAAALGTRAPAGERLQRWGRRATVVAALCPLPYALLRMTWLTPWPQGLGPGHEEMLDHGIRVFGASLGLAALGGAWLTLGLIARWGEVWPRWLPGLRGRPVPVLAAVVPAGVVSVVLCAAALSLTVMAVRDGSPMLVLMIPAPLWGPALGLATYAYLRRRTDPVASAATPSAMSPTHATGQPPDERPERGDTWRTPGS
ncbi:hypothetical protein ACI8AF_24815 [Blastococcus sp. SYSU D00669]